MSTLKKLYDENIFYIDLNTSLNLAIFTENCDSHFSCDLNKEEMAELIKELTAIYDLMPLEHEWTITTTHTWEFCSKCGVVRRKDGKNNPCKGQISIGLREVNPQTAGE